MATQLTKENHMKGMLIGSLADHAKLAELRSDAARLESSLDFEEKRKQSSALGAEAQAATMHVIILTGESTALKHAVLEENAQARIDSILRARIERGDDPRDIARSSSRLVGLEEFPPRQAIAYTLAREISKHANNVNEFLDSVAAGDKRMQPQFYAFVESLYCLTLLKGYSMDYDGGRELMDAFYLWRNLPQMDAVFPRDVANIKVPGTPLDWADNLKSSHARLAKELDGALKAERLADGAFQQACEAQRRAQDKARRFAKYEADPEVDSETASAHLRKKLWKKNDEISSLLDGMVSGVEEAKVKSFSGLGKDRLGELSSFWESFPEHREAKRSLALIYEELGSYDKALSAIDSDISGRYCRLVPGGKLEYAVTVMGKDGKKTKEKRAIGDDRLDNSDVVSSLEIKKRILEKSGDRKGAEKARLDIAACKILLWSHLVSKRHNLPNFGSASAVRPDRVVVVAVKAEPAEEACEEEPAAGKWPGEPQTPNQTAPETQFTGNIRQARAARKSSQPRASSPKSRSPAKKG